jgi:hypothetical protein
MERLSISCKEKEAKLLKRFCREQDIPLSRFLIDSALERVANILQGNKNG